MLPYAWHAANTNNNNQLKLPLTFAAFLDE